MANPALTTTTQTQTQATTTDTAAATAAGAPATTAVATVEGSTALPDQVGYVPIAKPGGESPAEVAIETAEKTPPQAVAATEQAKPEAEPAKTAEAAQAKMPVQQDTGFYLTNGPADEPEAPKKKGLFASLFGSSPAKAAAPEKAKPLVATAAPAAETAEPAKQAAPEKAKPIITLASAKADSKPLELASLGGGSSGGDSDWALPGVRTTDLFEIKRKSGINDDSDVDLHEDEDPGLQLASAAGMARLAPNGLLKQTESVDVACLKPSLVRVLKTVEQRFGKKMVITSGYRNPERNRRARGAKNSQHMYCAAADIQVPGVSKWELATFLRSMPGRGGVGTYCHTNSVHVDIGPERDWNWRCGRRKSG